MNTLKVARQLQEAGCEAKLAETLSLVIEEAVDTKAATREDLNNLKSELKLDLSNLKTELKNDIKSVQISLMIMYGASFLGQLGFIFAMLKFMLGK